MNNKKLRKILEDLYLGGKMDGAFDTNHKEEEIKKAMEEIIKHTTQKEMILC